LAKPRHRSRYGSFSLIFHLLITSQVKGGGHSSNIGFSSTPGVQIAMYKFSEVLYHPDNGTADVGTGLIWDDVYAGVSSFSLLAFHAPSSTRLLLALLSFPLDSTHHWNATVK
jgi:hypothetical protein